KDPNAAVNAAQVLAGSPQEAAATAKRIAGLPEVAQTRTLDRFVPADQERKLPLIARAATALRAALDRAEKPAPSDAENVAALRGFARAVLVAAPNATGQAISTFEWADTIIWSFEVAAAVATVSIALLLWIVLRRFGDVLLTLIPLIVAAAVTLEVCALTGFPLNYANIIALPVLLGVGVAFKIYYILAWRRGQTDFLQSALTRAVFFSALLTATAFGSLWLSHHPGTSSMGKLLALSLACTLVSAVLFQPALMGEPRHKSADLPPEPPNDDAHESQRHLAMGRS